MRMNVEAMYKVELEMTDKEVGDFVTTVNAVLIEITKHGIDPEQIGPLLSFKDELVMATRNAQR